MDTSVMHHLENELSRLWKRYGASPKQRDAWYWGFVIGIEIESKKRGLSCKTNYFNYAEIMYPMLLKHKIYRFFIKKGFSMQEKRFFDKGLSDGKLVVSGLDSK